MNEHASIDAAGALSLLGYGIDTDACPAARQLWTAHNYSACRKRRRSSLGRYRSGLCDGAWRALSARSAPGISKGA
ncbi:protein of unknown function (plasmid) [Cupriavidus taiwanensis]|uniref:Uncharacterized protein n=1 Tax=Cupriavidus taiwanensis TaxID=164546 RepID=A0A375FJB9_9BURK|nr:protein of unknown function [Cupriavidus taiwanensis]SPA57340.1 protein of unknown function [Cupriavidus taiwanensis]SPD49164.1 protein of unknown function [Cupriavidus taiwanensis]